MSLEKIDPDVKKLVLWIIDISMPSNFKLSLGSKGTFNKEEMKQHVKAEDEVGCEIVRMQLDFIKSVSTGQLSELLAE